jgi:mycofactocin precursor
MSSTVTDPTRHHAQTGTTDDEEPAEDLVEDELLVEEISIDGMCGVY